MTAASRNDPNETAEAARGIWPRYSMTISHLLSLISIYHHSLIFGWPSQHYQWLYYWLLLPDWTYCNDDWLLCIQLLYWPDIPILLLLWPADWYYNTNAANDNGPLLFITDIIDNSVAVLVLCVALKYPVTLMCIIIGYSIVISSIIVIMLLFWRGDDLTYSLFSVFIAEPIAVIYCWPIPDQYYWLLCDYWPG